MQQRKKKFSAHGMGAVFEENVIFYVHGKKGVKPDLISPDEL